jgi:hypothetical protein
MAFNYYSMQINNTIFYYYIGVNPETLMMEFYYFNENYKNWQQAEVCYLKNNLGSFEDSYDYRVKCSEFNAELRVFDENSKVLLSFPRPGYAAPENIFLDPLPSNVFPSDLKTQKETLSYNYVQNPKRGPGTNLQILGIFMAILGTLAVALAFTVLNTATLGGLGIVALCLGVGFFAAGTYRNNQMRQREIREMEQVPAISSYYPTLSFS